MKVEVKKESPDSFKNWLLTWQDRIDLIKLWPIATSVIALITFIYKIRYKEDSEMGSFIILSLNLSLLVFIILILIFLRNKGYIKGNINTGKMEREDIDKLLGHFSYDTERELKHYSIRARKLISQFYYSLDGFWVSMIILYFLLLWQTYYPVKNSPPYIIIDFFVTFINNIGCVAVISAFLVMFRKTLKPVELWNKLVPVCVVVAIITITHASLLAFSMATNLQQPYGDLHDCMDINVTFSVVSGFANAIAMTLLFARFESTAFNAPVFMLALLYMYAAAQTMYGLFEVTLFGYVEILKDATTFFTLIGKCVLFLYLLWIFETKRLFYYFLRTPKELEKVQGTSWEFISNQLDK